MNMKNIFGIFGYTLLSAAILAGFQACRKEAAPQVIAISAVSPEDNASADLADGNVRFSWEASGPVPGGFELVISADAEGTETKTYELPSTVFSREIKAVDMDLMLKNWGKPAAAASEIMWTVRPAVDGEATAAEWRTLNVTRLETETVEIYLRTPRDNAFFDLGGENTAAEFAWEGDPSITGYRIEFSTKEDGDAINVSDVKLEVSDAMTMSLSASDLGKILEASGVDDDIAVLWWKIYSTDELTPGASESRRIRLMKAGTSGVSPVANLSVTPGYERFILTADIIDPRTAKIVISYGEGLSETVETDSEQEILNFEKTGVAQNEYDFSVTSYNAGGEASEPVTFENVSVYGTAWMADKQSRQMTLSALTEEGAEFKIGALEHSDLKYSELIYAAGGQETVMRVENDVESVVLPAGSFDMAQTVVLKSYYAPAALTDYLDTVSPETPQTAYLPEYGILVPLDGIGHWPADDNTGALPNEMTNYNTGFPYAMLFDGITGDHLNMWHTSGSEEKVSEDHPIIATFDLGAEYNLSSYRVWGRNPWYADGVLGSDSGPVYWAFGCYNPRKFKLYGSAEEPQNTSDESYWAVNGGWIEDWTLLADSEVIRPSGVDDPKVMPTDEDIAAAEAGAEFPVALSDSPVRYVRLVITETWNPDQLYRISFGELHFFSYTPQK